MVNQELDYTIPSRPLVCGWVLLAFLMTSIGIWSYPLNVMIVFSAVIVIWMNLYSTVLHYALDAEEFTRLPVVGQSVVTFQSHHFPRWINTIHRKPVVDLLGELTAVAMLNLLVPLLIVRFRYREVFVAWGTLMLAACYATLCHRWAHQSAGVRPRIATTLQRARLALSPSEHMRHHALATSAQASFIPNFDVFVRMEQRVVQSRISSVAESATMACGPYCEYFHPSIGACHVPSLASELIRACQTEECPNY
jgi:hypothetical protein